MNYQTYDYFARSGQLLSESFNLVNDVISHPANPFSYTWSGRIASATLETAIRVTQRYDKLGFDINNVQIEDSTYQVREDVVLNKPFCNLVHFNKMGHVGHDKVLLVAPLSGHHATLLKGTVEALLPNHEIYITDWADAREVPLEAGPFSFDCYVEYLIEFMNHLGGDTHMIAICQPTVQALIATAVMSQENNPNIPRTLTLMAGPLDTTKNPTRVNEFSHQKPMSWFENVAIMEVPFGYAGTGRKVYPGFMQLGGFISMNKQTHLKKHATYFQNLLFGEKEDADRFRAFYDEYMAVLDMPAEFYLETIERVFKNNEIANQTITYKGKKVDFSAIEKTALLTVEGAEDDICGIGQTEAAQDLCVNIPKQMRKHHVQPGAGHYGIFSGSMYRKNIRPLVTEFIDKYC
ncbi:polyhydroxyalkanoate depolymerase [Glaciecola sp. KUL10]|uniref:polyhydroxyalkanoate depolymerase n=1 Tax=Glaciecola sp. (strain KUL10) TaxID=2161813 RepID=UPI000D78AECB|nr:polyhydroxyalkanoate depolymerase [Glaciecola sp. KUL10]GBL03696.1 polyhydroxyalkanoate depolymerase [Glaciecola sp. KUL10]